LAREVRYAGAKYVIWSTLPQVYNISDGKLNVEHFDTKAEIEEYLRDLPIKSSSFAPGFFMQNFMSHRMPPRLSSANDGTYVLANLCKGNTLMPLIDATNSGKWVGAILAKSDEYEGKYFAAAQGLYTWDEIAQIISNVTMKTVEFQHVPDDVFRDWMPEGLRYDLHDMYTMFREHGYYGKKTRENITWAAERARRSPMSLEEFLRRENFKLD
ncbi:hypothetical protein C7974DRAFT_442791, partial [Boeremia exigua]|uniref:uncharacterized protein n=1 Tax=Boeremia exigua TaxID=749465 RepID=UPI001E8C9F8D